MHWFLIQYCALCVMMNMNTYFTAVGICIHRIVPHVQQFILAKVHQLELCPFGYIIRHRVLCLTVL